MACPHTSLFGQVNMSRTSLFGQVNTSPYHSCGGCACSSQSLLSLATAPNVYGMLNITCHRNRLYRPIFRGGALGWRRKLNL
jgi:hypothetical protein